MKAANILHAVSNALTKLKKHSLNQVMLKLLGTMAKLKNSTNGENSMMDDQKKLSNFMIKLASLIDEYGVQIFYTSDDDGVHFSCGGVEVALHHPTSDELIQHAMFMPNNIESEAKAIAAKYYSIDTLKNQNSK